MSGSHEFRAGLVSPMMHIQHRPLNTTRKAGLGECDKPTSFAILDHFYQSGGNFVDT